MNTLCHQSHRPITAIIRTRRDVRLRDVLARLLAGTLAAALASALCVGAATGAPMNTERLDEGPEISELRVQVMPEFDDPRVLVIVQGRLSVTEEDLPVELTLPVPRGAQINQMAIMNTSSGAIESQPFDAAADPDDAEWTLVTYELTSAHFFYEYYYAPFATGDPERRFDFDFTTPYPIQGLRVEVQQPLKATDFFLVPPATLAQYDEAAGFTYHLYEIGNLGIGETLELSIAYHKDTPEPSITREELLGSQMMGSPDGMTDSPDTPTPGLWVGTGVAGIVGLSAAAWAWKRQGSAPNGTARATTTSTQHVAPVSPLNSDGAAGRKDYGAAYCTECGAKLREAARFCHVCGTRTYVEEA